MVAYILLFTVSALFLLVWLLNRRALRKKEQELINSKAEKEREFNSYKVSTATEIDELQNEIQALLPLRQYSDLINIEKAGADIITNSNVEASSIIAKAKEELRLANIKSSQILQDAINKANSLVEEASAISKQGDELIAKAMSDAKIIVSNGRDKAQALIGQSELKLKRATIEADNIITIANERAEEIAGEAFRALKEADRLEQTAQAMQNVIEGYGDKYLIPPFTLLDELAEEYSHVEAGNELKSARERIRLMVANQTAAQCEYVENHRRKTAINFVLDAFNGKVDSALSMVKHDNYGTLEQKLKDAYRLVNNLGRAFRNAVITEEYLLARLMELHWATVIQELKLKEREEQRQIRELMREEEKARREFEKAMKDAAKEEDMLRRAIEKAQNEVSRASEEQKVSYELKLLELTNKLLAAEERNQRALSMAQQTRTGHVYIISNVGSFGEHVYKIGMTRRLEPLDRVKELGDASVPFEFDVHALILSDDAPALEKQLHKVFLQSQINKINPRKEFFKVSLKDIRKQVESLGIVSKWTMTSEAREYKESLAMDTALNNNLALKEKWINYQLEAADTLEREEEIKA